MKKLSLSFIFLLLIAYSISGQTTDTISVKDIADSTVTENDVSDSIMVKDQENDSILYLPNNAFKIGEKLKYDAKYGIIKGGEITVELSLVPVGYTYVYHAKGVGKTSGVASKFYTVLDVYETYFDVETGLPIWAIRNIREENYRRYNEIRFFRDQDKLHSLKSGDHEASKMILDILSAFYYARTFIFKNLEKEKEIKLETFFDDEFFDIEIRFLGYKKIKTNFGRINCLEFGPVVSEDGPFNEDKDLRIWFTNDGNFIPVRVKIQLDVGTVKMELTGYSGEKNKFGTDKEKKYSIH